MRSAALLMAALLALPAAAAGWLRLEMVLDTAPHSAAALVDAVEARLADDVEALEVEADGEELTFSALVPADGTAETIQRRIAVPGRFGLHRVVDYADNCKTPPADLLCLPIKDPDEPALLVHAAELDNAAIKDARSEISPYTEVPAISLQLTSEAAKTFASMTAQSVGKQIAVVMDGYVVVAPRVMQPILGGSLYIDGQFTVEEAREMAWYLRHPPLPGPVTVASVKTAEADPPGIGVRLRRLFD